MIFFDIYAFANFKIIKHSLLYIEGVYYFCFAKTRLYYEKQDQKAFDYPEIDRV